MGGIGRRKRRERLEMMAPGEPVRRREERARAREERKARERETRETRRQELRQYWRRRQELVQGLERQVLGRRKAQQQQQRQQQQETSDTEAADDTLCLDAGAFRRFERLLRTHAALGEEGLFRVPGRAQAVAALLDLVVGEAGDEELARGHAWRQVHDVASALKLYLQSLEEPLCTFGLYDAFVASHGAFEEAGETEAAEEAWLAAVAGLLARMPVQNRAVLASLVRLLRDVVAQEERNRMSAANCSVVFGPVVLRPRAITADYIFLVRSQCKLVELMLLRTDVLFPELTSASQATDAAVDVAADASVASLSAASAADGIANGSARARASLAAEQRIDSGRRHAATAAPTVLRANLREAETEAEAEAEATAARVAVGAPVPHFQADDWRGDRFDLWRDVIREGRKSVLLFFGPTVTAEDIKEANSAQALVYYANCTFIGVVGCSSGEVQALAEAQEVAFTLLADADGAVSRLFGLADEPVASAEWQRMYVVAASGVLLQERSAVPGSGSQLMEALTAVSGSLGEEAAGSTGFRRRRIEQGRETRARRSAAAAAASRRRTATMA